MTSRPGRDRDRRTPSRTRANRSGAAAPKHSSAPRSGARKQPANARPGAAAARPRRRFVRNLVVAAVVVIAILALSGIGGCAALSASLPDPSTTKARGRDQSTVILDRNGGLLARLFAEQNRSDQPLQKMPSTLRQAVVATEDQRFYEHAGVDPAGIARALVTDVVLGKKSQGGSTITQQYIKNAFGTPEKTLKRKVEEALLANKIEKSYTKDQILELYLNTIYFGHGAYGVESASQVYFGKSVDKLDLAESAMLAGVIKSPGRYSPYLEPSRGQTPSRHRAGADARPVLHHRRAGGRGRRDSPSRPSDRRAPPLPRRTSSSGSRSSSSSSTARTDCTAAAWWYALHSTSRRRRQPRRRSRAR